ncbi:hypothetical protein MUP77_14850 [Candidatus Bathyarchaeota archaeon]|nr:hypothetical protein [Candidatus Bathyarchaeota archaeon]
MPQENYRLEEFNWDENLESLSKSSLVLGDLSGEEISRTRGVLCAHIKVKDDKVAFNLSKYGKLQISHPNAELLTRARSQLDKLIICSRWVPISPIAEEPSKKEPQEKRTLSEKYPSLMDLPEAKKADWTRIPREEIDYINRLWGAFQLGKGYEFLLDPIRSTLASYAKSNTPTETKSLKEKATGWLSGLTKK